MSARRDPVSYEGAVWTQIEGTWRQLHGSFPDRGLSIEWHDFTVEEELPWSASFHPDSLEICLNLSGSARVRSGNAESSFGNRTVAIYTQETIGEATRETGDRHQFLTVELSRDFLQKHLGAQMEELQPAVRAFLSDERSKAPLTETRSMTPAEYNAFSKWPAPTLSPAAHTLWYEAKVLGLLATLFFKPQPKTEMFCARQKRLARERMERVMAILRERLHEPPTLEELAREVGCSSFYLSRTFSEQAGQTIPQFIRQIRMERAAELLREGKMNVTEVAFEVGYSSLGHFSKSFCEVIGVCPSLYPAASALTRKLPRKRGSAI